ncbi:MAG: beta-glucosidase [Clostridia bacterium]|nr:beta-glucosidase [Clostridia bacterium]
MSFKKDFAWGVATSSQQIEGAYNEGGKGLNIWDVFCHEPNKIKDETTSDVACDHYHRFKDDIKLMASLGINSYRFSISWARIFPNGVGKINEEGVRFYSDLIDELLFNNIKPYITLFHWDYPYALHKKGGWLNDESIEWFANYASKIVELYSDRVTHFITFNEPQCFVGIGYLEEVHAPGLSVSYKDAFQMSHNVMKAHGAAVIAMRKSAKQPIQIGYAPTCVGYYPASDTKEDIEAARKALFNSLPLNKAVLMDVTWWSDPVILGKYPEEGLKLYADYLPEITEEDLRLINQPIDFYAQNIYQGREVKAGENGEPIINEKSSDLPLTAMGWQITPKCLYWGARFLTERYKLPFYITENGMAMQDEVSNDKKVHDDLRVKYYELYLAEVERAVNDGVDIRGYFAWSFMDNFEWAEGYRPRFGIVHVDYNTLKRTPKDSALWYKEYIKKHS